MTVKIDGSGIITGTYTGPVGQVVLELVGNNLQLNPKDGNYLLIGGIFRQVPASGPILAPTGLTVGTNYYIYASWNGTAIVLSADATAPVTDSAWGLKVKGGTGGGAFTLVGWARPVAGPAWEDSLTNRFVMSWYNKREKVAQLPFLISYTAGNAGLGIWTRFNPVITFMTWANETSRLTLQGFAAPAAGAYCMISFSIDDSPSPIDPSIIVQQVGSAAGNIGYYLQTDAYFPSDGIHTLKTNASSQGGSTIFTGAASVGGNSLGRCMMTAVIKG